MMHFGVPVQAYDCDFNRHTTENWAAYFSDASELNALANDLASVDNGEPMKEIANRRYTWDEIGARYFALLLEDR